MACLVHAQPARAQAYDGRLIDAVRITLERQSFIAVSRQEVSIGEAEVLSARGAFDPVIEAGTSFQRTTTPLSDLFTVTSVAPPYSQITAITADTNNYQASLTKKLRSGMTFNTALKVTHTLDNYSNFNSPSYANVALNFSLPLARGQGEAVTTAYERAAQLRRDAALQNSKHAVVTAITTTVLAYWNYLAAQQTLDIARATEARANSLLNDARKLAAATLVPQLDVRKFESRLPSQAASRIGAEEAVVRARGNLGLAMGLKGSEIASIPAPTDGFQLIHCCGDINTATLHEAAARLAATAQQGRADLLSLESSMRATEALLLAAHDGKKSQLDLLVSVGYNGMNDRRVGTSTPPALAALGSNVRGGNAFIGLNYTFPVNNHAAMGQVLQQTAVLEQIQLQKRALEDNIASSIEIGLNGLLSAADQLQQAQTAIRIQTEVYEGENKKYRYGMSSLLDLFTNEAQLVTNQLSLVNTQLVMACAMIKLRFDTGTLFSPDSAAQTIDDARLVSVPKPAGAPALVP